MSQFITYLSGFFIEKNDPRLANLPLLLLILVILFLAFELCVVISKKNKLYIRTNKEENKQRIIRENGDTYEA